MPIAHIEQPTTNDKRPTTAPMGTRRKSRELALQMLFQADLGKQLPEEVRSTFWGGRGEVADDVQGFAEDLFRVACDRATDMDKMIEEHTDNGRMYRMD